MRRLQYLVLCGAMLLAAALHVKAQQPAPRCAWIDPGIMMKKDPARLAALKAAEHRLRMAIGQNGVLDADSIYTLPVVIHVIHTGTPVGSADNPTDAQIAAMITNLNNTWRKIGASFGGVDMKMQFQLATRDPNGNASSGIVRVNGSAVTNYASGGITNIGTAGSADEHDVKILSRWPNTDYINIWVVNKINGSSVSPGGYAYFPDLPEAAVDGIVINASVVDGSNKTLTHEMGHVFALFHTFHDYELGTETTCAPNDDCSTEGDEICDTEPHLVQYDCLGTTNDCTGSPYTIADAGHGYTVLNNYMGYTNCQFMFTADQKTRARAALFTFRHGLISSGALQGMVTAFPATGCTVTAANAASIYYGVERFEFNDLFVYSNTSNKDGQVYVDRSINQATTVIKGQSYTATVAGSYGNPAWNKLFIDYNNDGDFDDAGETLIAEFSFSGVSTTSIVIPSSGIVTGIPLRIRVVSDNPAAEPDACHLYGDAPGGSGQVEDFRLYIANRQIASVASGNWNNPATWSCNCIPQADDEVTIKNGHVVQVPVPMGLAECLKLVLESGSEIQVAGALRVNGQ